MFGSCQPPDKPGIGGVGVTCCPPGAAVEGVGFPGPTLLRSNSGAAFALGAVAGSSTSSWNSCIAHFLVTPSLTKGIPLPSA